MRVPDVVVLGLALAIAAPAAAAVELETEEQKIIYTLGRSLARNLGRFDLSGEEIEILQAGLADALADRPAQVEESEYRPKINELVTRRGTALGKLEKEASRSFLEAAAAEPGAILMDSGLVYRETQPGSGAKPRETDTVSVHYPGTLRDGTVFDSSVERDEPATFPVSRVIPCWQEALQRMHVGAKATVTCPAEIAYGNRGAGTKIKPGAALRFEVELLGIEG